MTAAKTAAQAYVDQMRPGDKAGLLTFNTKVTYRQVITSDRTLLIQTIDTLDARGDTTMFDALTRAAQILQDVSGRKAIIVLTDGLDNRSKHTADEVIQAIGTGGLSISTIGLGDPSKLGINSGLDEATLKSLAARAGGVYGYASDPSGLIGLYEQYGRTLQSEYSITYVTSSSLRDGLSRALTVSVDGSTSTQGSYNPGGVLPEVSRDEHWLLFATILVGLVVLLFVTGLVDRILMLAKPRKEKGSIRMQSPRIKLK